MTYDGRLRACGQDRETALGVLRDAYAAGRLRPEECWFLAIHAILVSLIVLMAGLAGRVTSAAAWSAYALIPLAVVLPTFLGRRQLRRHDKAQPPTLPAPPAAQWRHRCVS